MNRNTFAERQRQAVKNMGTVAEGLSEMQFPVLRLPKHPYGKNAREAFALALKDAEKVLLGTHEDKRRNGIGVYAISKRSLQKIASSFRKSEFPHTYIAVLNNLPILILNSIEVEEHPDVKKENGVRLYENGINEDVLIHELFGAIAVDGCYYRTRIVIKEYKSIQEDNKLYAYEAIEIELSDVTGSKEHIIEPYSPFGQHLATLSGAKLLKGVTKANQPGKFLLDEQSCAHLDGIEGLMERERRNAVKGALNKLLKDNKTAE